MKGKKKYAGFSDLEELKNAYLLLAGKVNENAAEEEESAQKAGAEAENFPMEGENTPGREAYLTPQEEEADLKQAHPCGSQECAREKIPFGKEEIIFRRVRRFLRNYPAARYLKDKILAQLEKDPALERTPYCLEIALGRAAGGEYLPPDVMVREENFIRDYIMKDADIKGRIIEEYLSSVADNMPPAVMAASGKMAALPPSRPTSVNAAGKLFERMLKDRRI